MSEIEDNDFLEDQICCGIKNKILSREGNTYILHCSICNKHTQCIIEKYSEQECGDEIKELLDILEKKVCQQKEQKDM